MDSAATQCQFCWRVRENGADARGGSHWGELATFLQKHEAQPQDFTLSEGYCPQCNTFYSQLTQRNMLET